MPDYIITRNFICVSTKYFQRAPSAYALGYYLIYFPSWQLGIKYRWPFEVRTKRRQWAGSTAVIWITNARLWRPIAGSNWIVAVFGGPQRAADVRRSIPPKAGCKIYLEWGVYINFKKVLWYLKGFLSYCKLRTLSVVSEIPLGNVKGRCINCVIYSEFFANAVFLAVQKIWYLNGYVLNLKDVS